jgi:hypothetical protein
MKLLLLIAGGLAAVVAFVLIVGALLPKAHEASRSIVLSRAPREVYQTIRDFDAAPTWRRDLQRVELLGETDGRLRFREHGSDGAVTYEVVDDQPGRLLVTRIVDRDLGYSGSWTYALTSEGEGTRVTITERGEVSNLLFRFLSRFVFGHTRTIDTYLSSLSEHLRAG